MPKVSVRYTLGGGFPEDYEVTEQEAREALTSWERRETFIVVGKHMIDRSIVECVTILYAGGEHDDDKNIYRG